MSELNRESRALLTATRHLDHLGAADKARIRGKLTQRLGAGLALGSAMTAGATVAQAARPALLASVATWLPGTAKLLGIVAISSAAAVGAVQVARPFVPSEGKHPLAAPSAVAVGRDDTPPRAVEMLAPPTASVMPETATVDSMPSLAPPTSPKHRSPPGGASRPTGIVDPADDSLASQVAVIRESRAALRRGDATAALAALDRQGVQGLGGPLEQEALVARVTALCLQGDLAAARRVAEQFLVRFPKSLLVPRIRSSCAFDSTTVP